MDLEFFYSYKVDANSIIRAKLMARDGALTVLIPVTGGSLRFVLQKGIESEIEQFIHHLNEIKARGKLANVFVFYWYNTLGRRIESYVACVRALDCPGQCQTNP